VRTLSPCCLPAQRLKETGRCLSYRPNCSIEECMDARHTAVCSHSEHPSQTVDIYCDGVMTTRTPILSLPPACLALVFQYLDFWTARTTDPMVCKPWRDICAANSYCPYHTVDCTCSWVAISLRDEQGFTIYRVQPESCTAESTSTLHGSVAGLPVPAPSSRCTGRSPR
jgi:hypothetical protein